MYITKAVVKRGSGYVRTVPVVKRSVAECVPDRASVHARNATFEAVSAPDSTAPLRC